MDPSKHVEQVELVDHVQAVKQVELGEHVDHV